MSKAARRGHGGDCEALLSTIMGYLDRELSPARTRELQRHLASCTCCDDLAENLRVAMALCRAEGKRGLPPAVTARARARVAELLGRSDRR